MADLTDALQSRVAAAYAGGTALAIRGGGSKSFYGRAETGEPLELAGHSGVLRYEPSELVITARAGTPLDELENVLAEAGQMLPFEPPRFGAGGTLGGAVAAGLSGPRRPYAGALRDFVLGTRLINGRGELLRFGGEVIKNVAGYDVSRAMVGALGTLGVLLEVSLKVLPRPERELTLVQPCGAQQALHRMNAWGLRPLPISGVCHLDRCLFVRLSGAERAIEAAQTIIGGDCLDEEESFWQELRDQRLPFFGGDDTPLWRLALPADAPPLELAGEWLFDWGGAQRWLRSAAPPAMIRAAAAAVGGHATLFRGTADVDEVFQPLAPSLHTLHRRLKQAFDPGGILNPGRLYATL